MPFSAAATTDSLALVLPPTPSVVAGAPVSAPVHFRHLITLKLSAENHLFWRAQVLSHIRSHLLHGYIEGTFKCPPATLTAAGVVSPNPAFAVWIQQDQAIISSFLSSSTIEVQGMIMFARTSAEAWSTLERSFASQSSARSSHIRSELQALKKNDSSAAVYYNKIKALSDTLTSIGQPLRPEEFKFFVVDGLDEEYDSLAQIVLDRDLPMPAHDLYSRLLATEHRVEGRRAAGNIHSANVAKTGGKSFRSNNNYSSKPSYAPKPAAPMGGPASGATAPMYKDGSPVYFGRAPARTVCQLCDGAGHVAARCFKRFNK